MNFHRQKINKEKGKKEPLALERADFSSHNVPISIDKGLPIEGCRRRKREGGAVLPPVNGLQLGFAAGETIPHRTVLN